MMAPMRPLLCVAFLLAVSVTAHAAPLQEPATLCEQAITRAEAVGRTPLGMLAAVGQVESGRPDSKTGGMRPWPWAIDADGVGQFRPGRRCSRRVAGPGGALDRCRMHASQPDASPGRVHVTRSSLRPLCQYRLRRAFFETSCTTALEAGPSRSRPTTPTRRFSRMSISAGCWRCGRGTKQRTPAA